MSGFDPDEYGGYDGEDDEMYAVENAYFDADRTKYPIPILLECSLVNSPLIKSKMKKSGDIILG